MSEIKANIVDQTISLTDVPAIFSGNINIDVLSCGFNTTWDEFIKTACFYVDPQYPYLEVLDADKCNIPKEVLANAGDFYFGVFGVSGDKVITTEIVKYKIGEGIMTAGSTPEPSDDIWQQILNKCNEALSKVNQIQEEHNEFNIKLTKALTDLNTAIGYMGEYQWRGTQIRFRQGDGSWGAYRDIAGNFASKDDLKTLNSYTKQLFLAFHPVGSVVEFTNETDNPQTMFGGTWEIFEKNHPTYTIVDSIVKNATGTDFIDLISWSQIVMKFQEQYNIIPMSQDTSEDNGNNNTVFVDVSNGHVEASYVKMYNIQWATRSGERVIVVVFDDNPPSGQKVRINFKMTYVDKTITYYKWKRID